MKRPRLDIRNAAKSPTSSGVPARRAGIPLNHLQIAVLARAVQFVVGQWGDDDTLRNGVDGSTTTAPTSGLIHHAEHIATLGVLIGFQRVVDSLQKRQI